MHITAVKSVEKAVPNHKKTEELFLLARRYIGFCTIEVLEAMQVVENVACIRPQSTSFTLYFKDKKSDRNIEGHQLKDSRVYY